MDLPAVVHEAVIEAFEDDENLIHATITHEGPGGLTRTTGYVYDDDPAALMLNMIETKETDDGERLVGGKNIPIRRVFDMSEPIENLIGEEDIDLDHIENLIGEEDIYLDQLEKELGGFDL